MTPPAPTAASTSRGRRARMSATRSTAARAAAGPWAARTAYNRGQILYRAAEALESRGGAATARPQTAAADGPTSSRPRSTCSCTTPAGPTSSSRCSAGSIPSRRRFCRSRFPSRPASSAIVAPDEPDLLGLVAELAPALAAGNTVVAILSETRPLAGLDLAEVLGVADIPAGVVNLLSGRRAELGRRARRPPRRQRDRRCGRRRRAVGRARAARRRDDQARAPPRRGDQL